MIINRNSNPFESLTCYENQSHLTGLLRRREGRIRFLLFTLNFLLFNIFPENDKCKSKPIQKQLLHDVD